jgi:hypothetical protein
VCKKTIGHQAYMATISLGAPVLMFKHCKTSLWFLTVVLGREASESSSLLLTKLYKRRMCTPLAPVRMHDTVHQSDSSGSRCAAPVCYHEDGISFNRGLKAGTMLVRRNGAQARKVAYLGLGAVIGLSGLAHLLSVPWGLCSTLIPYILTPG